jgi:outer membrane biogenesis lipoprotein LolB
MRCDVFVFNAKITLFELQILAFWVMTSCSQVGEGNTSEEHTSSIFRVEFNRLLKIVSYINVHEDKQITNDRRGQTVALMWQGVRVRMGQWES